MTEYLVATSYELWMMYYVLYFVALMTIVAEIFEDFLSANQDRYKV